jgi:wyosine [tRNA(Phe)-imidazoG37] synthetase (radical SAM superfamily)
MEAIVNERYLPPVVFNLDVTGKCQYRCGHCHHRAKQIQDKQLPDLPERLARTLPYFLKHWKKEGVGVEACCIVGSQGDAMLYPELPSLLRELHFAGIEVGLVTNGYAMTGLMIDYAAYYTKFIGFSMDAGTENSYKKIKKCPNDAWNRVTQNINSLCITVSSRGLRNDIGWKILVLPDTQYEIYESCVMAKRLGCRYVQIRPADLPKEKSDKINVDMVAEQIRKAIHDLEELGKFEIVGIRHKFTPDFKKILPKYCYLTPLTVTVTSDGKAYACVDRRCDESTLLADCGKYGWTALEEVWGTARHIEIVHDIINRCGKGPDCNIRCSNYGYDKFFQNYFVNDNVDWRLI